MPSTNGLSVTVSKTLVSPRRFPSCSELATCISGRSFNVNKARSRVDGDNGVLRGMAL